MELDHPNANLMVAYIQAFCDNLNVHFPFIAYDETLKQFFCKSLTPLMANCIAALAVRYSELPEVLHRGVMYVTDQYIDKAKTLLMAEEHIPTTLDTLHSLILLAWAEYKRNRLTHFCRFGEASYLTLCANLFADSLCQMAGKMALDLHLNDEMVILLAETEYERNNLRHTWQCAAALDATVRAQGYAY
ncbi:hypothetical protein NM688_g7384 [Phlebia brevispora]|uniref:Uncharacterized protein n=1 Tax=Phlebia brevispora TaxID=194682 RepID=A0ACC1S634_9APHY|nr:hypothetical protein NM688_g7384 [Phlebia brevispora]